MYVDDTLHVGTKYYKNSGKHTEKAFTYKALE